MSEWIAVADMHARLAMQEFTAKQTKAGADWTARASQIARAIECLERALEMAKLGHNALMESRFRDPKYAAPPASRKEGE